jgi:trehalose 6-phosphate phosphatase
MSAWPRIVGKLAESLAVGGTIFLVTDYDGTLTPIVRDPIDAWLSRDVLDDLRVLARCGPIRVAIVSGRRLDDLRTRVRIPEITYAGCHGLQIEGPGIVFRHSEAEATRNTLYALADALQWRTRSVPGLRVEPKGLSLAVHYRDADRYARVRLQTVLDEVIRPRMDVRTLRGRSVVEILPAVAWDKGQCALWLHERVRAIVATPLTTIYLGDDATDEPAFRRLHRRAMTVRVGWEATSRASYWVRDVADVHRILSALVAEVGRRAFR